MAAVDFFASIKDPGSDAGRFGGGLLRVGTYIGVAYLLHTDRFAQLTGPLLRKAGLATFAPYAPFTFSASAIYLSEVGLSYCVEARAKAQAEEATRTEAAALNALKGIVGEPGNDLDAAELQAAIVAQKQELQEVLHRLAGEPAGDQPLGELERLVNQRIEDAKGEVQVPADYESSKRELEQLRGTNGRLEATIESQGREIRNLCDQLETVEMKTPRKKNTGKNGGSPKKSPKGSGKSPKSGSNKKKKKRK